MKISRGTRGFSLLDRSLGGNYLHTGKRSSLFAVLAAEHSFRKQGQFCKSFTNPHPCQGSLIASNMSIRIEMMIYLCSVAGSDVADIVIDDRHTQAHPLNISSLSEQS